MCGSVKYTAPGTEDDVITIVFGNPYASLPVHHPSSPNGIDWVLWGRCANQVEGQSLPVTGWARLDMIEKGGWDKYHPEFVKIAVQQFSEKGDDHSRYWFDIDEGYAIEGIIAHSPYASRLFIVTTPVPDELVYIHDRWPKVVSLSGSQTLGKLNDGYRLNIPLSRKYRSALAA